MNHRFCIKGKKSGIVGSAISNFWSYVLFVFVVIIFFVFFSIQEREVRENLIGSIESEANMDLAALTYLRTPVSFETGSVLATNDKNFADFLIELLVPIYSGPTNQIQLWNAIDKKAKENLAGYRRLMIFTDIGACLYDSRNQECQYRQISYATIPEGTALLPIPIKPNDIKFVEVVFQ